MRVNFRAVLLDLLGLNWTQTAIAQQLGLAVSNVHNYSVATTPSHPAGESIIELWCPRHREDAERSAAGHRSQSRSARCSLRNHQQAAPELLRIPAYLIVIGTVSRAWAVTSSHRRISLSPWACSGCVPAA
jgi:hypothetical protein